MIGESLDDEGMQSLSFLPLRLLKVRECHLVSDRSCPALTGMPNLEYLSLPGSSLTDMSMHTLGLLTKLRTLSLHQGEHLNNFQPLASTSLDLSQTDFGAEHVGTTEVLSSFVNLTELNLNGTAICRPTLPLLSFLTCLTSLDLGECDLL